MVLWLVVVHEWLVVVVFVVIGFFFALVLDFKEFKMTSPPELAHCWGEGDLSGKFSFVKICYLESFAFSTSALGIC